MSAPLLPLIPGRSKWFRGSLCDSGTCRSWKVLREDPRHRRVGNGECPRQCLEGEAGTGRKRCGEPGPPRGADPSFRCRLAALVAQDGGLDPQPDPGPPGLSLPRRLGQARNLSGQLCACRPASPSERAEPTGGSAGESPHLGFGVPAWEEL